VTALVALTERVVHDALRNDLPFAALSPAANFIVFNFMLGNVIDTGGMSYPQYVLPVVVIQVTVSYTHLDVYKRQLHLRALHLCVPA